MWKTISKDEMLAFFLISVRIESFGEHLVCHDLPRRHGKTSSTRLGPAGRAADIVEIACRIAQFVVRTLALPCSAVFADHPHHGRLTLEE